DHVQAPEGVAGGRVRVRPSGRAAARVPDRTRPALRCGRLARTVPADVEQAPRRVGASPRHHGVAMTYEPSPLADVTYRPAGDHWTLVFVRDLEHPPEKVWTALTEPDHLARWAPYTSDRDLGTTGPAGLTMIDGETTMDLKAD